MKQYIYAAIVILSLVAFLALIGSIERVATHNIDVSSPGGVSLALEAQNQMLIEEQSQTPVVFVLSLSLFGLITVVAAIFLPNIIKQIRLAMKDVKKKGSRNVQPTQPIRFID